MGQDDRLGLADHAVRLLAGAMNAVGLNGTRVLWKWNRRRQSLAEGGLRTEMLWRSARGRHKMCPSCRALVPRTARACSECGNALAGVQAPGFGRLLANVLPGATTATSLLLLVNGLFFLLLLLVPGERSSGGGLGLLTSFDVHQLLRHGGGLGLLVVNHGEWWRLVTAMFLHGGLLHFGFNSYALLQLGPMVEETYGTERFWVLYLFSGVMGNAVSELLQPRTTVVGASGAIVGLIGLLLAYGIRRGGVAGGTIRRSMTQYAFFILIFSLLPGISLLNHLGGFVGGFLLGLIVPAGALRSRTQIVAWQLAATAGLVLVLVSFYQVVLHGADYTGLEGSRLMQDRHLITLAGAPNRDGSMMVQLVGNRRRTREPHVHDHQVPEVWAVQPGPHEPLREEDRVRKVQDRAARGRGRDRSARDGRGP